MRLWGLRRDLKQTTADDRHQTRRFRTQFWNDPARSNKCILWRYAAARSDWELWSRATEYRRWLVRKILSLRRVQPLNFCRRQRPPIDLDLAQQTVERRPARCSPERVPAELLVCAVRVLQFLIPGGPDDLPSERCGRARFADIVRPISGTHRLKLHSRAAGTPPHA
jgi:hypothetical protein